MGLQVIDPGLCASVQDRGRIGHARYGVPRGGAFDARSAGIANALVANMPEAAVLEHTLTAGVYEARHALALAAAGASGTLTIRQGQTAIRILEPPVAFTLEAGSRLTLAPRLAGARIYLAVRGGWQTPLVLGSRASEDRLEPGDLLPAAQGSTALKRPRPPRTQVPFDHPLRVLPGPDDPAGAWLQAIGATAFHVSPQSSRMGLRLEGPAFPLMRDPARLSSPVAPGAIQLAGDTPIVLGVACGTMGGYPHVAQVISADLHRLGQLRPAQTVTFEPVSLHEARTLDRETRANLRELLARLMVASSAS